MSTLTSGFLRVSAFFSRELLQIKWDEIHVDRWVDRRVAKFLGRFYKTLIYREIDLVDETSGFLLCQKDSQKLPKLR